MFGSLPCSAPLLCKGTIHCSQPVSQHRGRLQGICSIPNNLADVPHQLVESFRHWHNSLEEQASDHDYARFWAARAVSAAKTDEETNMAQELYSLDIVFQRSEELVQVLGVQPGVLIEILTCVFFWQSSLYRAMLGIGSFSMSAWDCKTSRWCSMDAGGSQGY